MDELPGGALFAGHRIEAVVGRGGMGVVYVAVHQRLKQRRALKVIAPEYCRDEQFRRRFEREWEVAAAIDHPHVIPIYDAGEDQGQLYIAMRYVDGTDLRSLIAGSGRLDAAYTAGVVGQIAEALDAAHARGLVHRDVKPANILIAETPDGAFAYLTDFGLTKGVSAETSGLTKTGVFVGTLDYIAPEQLDGVATSRSDIYALGCLTYHALSGQVPYPQPTAPAKMWAHIHAPPPHLSIGLPAMSDAVARAMAKNPDDRFGSAGEFGAALRAAVGGKQVPDPAGVGPELGQATVSEVRPVVDDPGLPLDAFPAAVATGPGRSASDAPPRQRPARRRPVPAIAALALLLIGGVVAAVISSSSGEEQRARSPIHARPAAAGGAKAHAPAKIVFTDHPTGVRPVARETIQDGAERLQSRRGLADAHGISFGSGGIVEFTRSGSDIWNYPMALDPTGHYVSSERPLEYRAIGEPIRDFGPADSAARKFVRSVRDDDCELYYKLTDSDESRHKVCSRYLRVHDSFARHDFHVAKRVDVFRLGGTRRMCFYGVRANGIYRTLSLENLGGLSTGTAGELYGDRWSVMQLYPRRGIPARAKAS